VVESHACRFGTAELGEHHADCYIVDGGFGVCFESGFEDAGEEFLGVCVFELALVGAADGSADGGEDYGVGRGFGEDALKAFVKTDRHYEGIWGYMGDYELEERPIDKMKEKRRNQRFMMRSERSVYEPGK